MSTKRSRSGGYSAILVACIISRGILMNRTCHVLCVATLVGGAAFAVASDPKIEARDMLWAAIRGVTQRPSRLHSIRVRM